MLVSDKNGFSKRPLTFLIAMVKEEIRCGNFRLQLTDCQFVGVCFGGTARTIILGFL